MEEKPEQSAASDNNPKPNLCQECNIEASKYTCPGCSHRTCSLACVNSHKQRTACSGKRPLTNVVPMSQFDDTLLLSDYNMLEDVKRVADSAQRTRVTVCGNSNFGLPFALKILRNAAGSRRIKLLFLSKGMSKREKNKTYFNKKNKCISWTVEWRFNSTDVVLLDHGINENSTLASAIEKHLKAGPWNHPLRQFCDQSLDSLKFFISKNPKGPKSPFCQVDINAPIREQLTNILILEYPVVHVFLPSHNCDFEVVNNANPRKVEIKEPAHHDCPSPKGVTFKEEEFNDGDSPDPRVSDLLSHSLQVVKEANSANPVSHVDTRTLRAEDTNAVTRSCIEELSEIPDLDLDLDFDFEPGSIDVYPDITAGVNSDDFFDFDEMLPEQKDAEYFIEEELEEGEIA